MHTSFLNQRRSTFLKSFSRQGRPASLKSCAAGFTLIELLVVIAIIGLLSAVVLAALGTARNKGNDAAVQTDLDSVRSQGELYFIANTNSYGTSSLSCTGAVFADPTVTRAIANATTNGIGSAICNSNGSAYVIEEGLKAAGGYWCVDSSGQSRKESAAITSSGVVSCP